MSTAAESGHRGRIAQRRQQTLDEIVEVARAQLRAQEAVSISSVASAMGMTPPAMYRYVPHLAGLNALINEVIVDELVQRMRAAAERQPDAPAKLVATATAFRQWALNNYAEYRAVFAPQCGPLARHDHNRVSPAGLASFAFAEVVVNVVTDTHPRLDDISVTDSYRRSCKRLALINKHLSAGASPEQVWVFERAWVKFLGVVSYEAFGFLDPEVVVSGDMFVSLMLEIGESIGLTQDVDRLLAIAVETAAWADEQSGDQPLHIQYAINHG